MAWEGEAEAWEATEAASKRGGFRSGSDPLAVREGSLLRYVEDARMQEAQLS